MKNFSTLKEPISLKINDVLKPLDLHIYELNNNNDFEDDTLQVLLEAISDPLKPLDLDLITKASEMVSTVLDGFDKQIEEPYALEVSSAGIERPIVDQDALNKAVGSYVHVELKVPDKEIKEFDANLVSYDPENDQYEFKFFIKGAPKKRKYAYKDIKFIRYAIKF